MNTSKVRNLAVALAILMVLILPMQRFNVAADALPNLWLSQDIGSPDFPGSADYANGVFTTTDWGCDLGDSIYYVYQQVSGDFTISARVTSFSAANSWAKGGVMVRKDLTLGSPMAFMSVTKGNGTISFWRTQAGGAISDEFTGDGKAPSYWTRIQREGNTYRGYKSADGTNWVLVSETNLSSGTDVYVGMAVAGGCDEENTSIFDNVTLAGSGPQPPANTPPVLGAIGNQTVDEGQTLQFTATATDAEGDDLSFSMINSPSGATLNGNTGAFSWTPTTSQAGSYTITLTVSDGQASDSETFVIMVNDVPAPPTNTPPVLGAIGNQTVDEGQTLQVNPAASDAEGDTLTFNIVNPPAGSTLDQATGEFSWTPTTSQAGSYTITLTVSDGQASDSETFVITVNDVPAPPPSGSWITSDIGSPDFPGSADYANGVFTTTDWGCDLGDSIYYVYQQVSGDFTISARVTSFSAANSWAKGGVMVRKDLTLGSPMAFMSVTKGNGTISFWRTQAGGAISDEFTGDGKAPSYWTRIQREGNTYRGYKSADGTNWVLVSETNLSSGTDVYVGMAVAGGCDEENTSIFDNVTLAGSGPQPPANTPPVLGAIGNQTVDEGQTLQFTATATDAEGDDLSFSMINSPSGATLNGNTGAFSWTPTTSQAGSYTITLTVSDGQASDSETFVIMVNDVPAPPTNTPPVLGAIGNQTVDEGQTLQVNPAASDAEGDTLTFNIVNPPAGSTLDQATGEFSWTPTTSQAGSYTITLTVSDGQASDSETFVITVNDVPAPPPSGITNFTSVRNATLNSVYSSNTITVLGFSGVAAMTASGGINTTIIKNGVDTGLASTPVTNGDLIRLKSRSAPMASITTTIGANIGGYTTSWSITTAAIAPLPAVAGSMSGYTPIQFTVNESGAAEFYIPVTVPPGTAGMRPDLAISYNNHGGNALLGAGMSLSGLSTITRCPSTIAQDSGLNDGVDFDGNDRFCLNGERLVAVNGAYGADGTEYRTEHESFTRVVSYGVAGDAPQKFVAQTKAGLTMEYGYTEDSRIQSQGKSNVLYWAVNKILDTKGNYLTIAYVENNANSEYYPTRIDYTGNANVGLAPYNSVQFAYEDRPDQTPLYVGGSQVKMTKRLVNIKTYNRSSVFREYRLSYSSSMATNRSHLTSIRECGSDGSCFAPNSFEWQSLTGYTPNFNGAGSGMWGGHNRGTTNNFVGDFDNNGKADLMKYADSPPAGRWNLRLSYGSGFDKPPLWMGHSGGVGNNFLGDFNADSRTDIAGYAGNGSWHVCLSTGTGFSCSYWAGHSGGQTNNVVGDFDGNGRSDMAGYAGNGSWHVCLSTGTGFNCSYWAGHSGGQANNVSADLNGDGLTDLAGYTGNGSWHVCLSTGMGFNCSYWAGHSGGQANNTVGDYNGDGKMDFAGYAGSGSWHVCLSTGIGFTCSYWAGHSGGQTNNLVGDYNCDGNTDMAGYDSVGQQWHVTLSTGHSFDGQGSGYWNGPKAGVGKNVAADFNGDGCTDIAGFIGPGNQWEVKLVGGVHPDLITKVTNGHGVATKFTYKPLTDSSVHTADTDATWARIDFRAPLYVVASYSTGNGVGGERKFTYHYTGAEMNLAGRGFRGFRQVEIVDQETGTRTLNDYNQDHRFVGTRITRTQQFLPNGVQISDVINTPTIKDVGPGLYWSYVQTSTAKRYEISGPLVSTTITTNDFDTFGNVLRVTVDYGNGYVDTNTNQYYNDTSRWLLGRLVQAEVEKTAPGQPTLKRTSAFVYDTESGLLTKETVDPNSSTLKLEKSYEHDAFGNILRSTVSGPGITSRSEITRYDPEGRFVLEHENALGQVKTSFYRLGRLETLTGPNGLTTTWTYDGFGRPTTDTRADGTQTRTLYLLCGSCPAGAKYFVRVDSSGAAPVIKYYDSVDREIRTETVAFSGGTVFVDTQYNSRGEVLRASDPYFEGTTSVWTNKEYDAIGRVAKETAPGGRVTTTSYQGLTTITTNPLEQQDTLTVNPKGKSVTSKDHLNSVVTNVYDSFGNLIKVIDPVGNITTISYNIRGNKTSLDDPDSGHTSYAYNALGELVSQTDAKGQTVSMSYDQLGRLVQRQEPEGTTNWEYDSQPMSIGKISRVTAPDGYLATYNYDSLGRMVESITTIGGEYFSVANTFDQYGRLDTVTYPTGLATRNMYTSGGYLSEVRRVSDDYRYWKLDAETARGQAKDVTLGNGRSVGYGYDPNTGHVTMISVGGAQLLGFQYDALGNLIERIDHIHSLSETFQYDPVSRLVQSSVAGGQTISVSYDTIGNIKSNSMVGTYTYGQNAGPHAVTDVNGAKANSYTYDLNGNRITSNGGTVAYTSYNKPSWITQGSAAVEFLYGPSRDRYQQVVQEGGQTINTKLYISGIYERETTGSLVKDLHYIVAGGETIAIEERQSDGRHRVLYLHKDHLGSVQTITDDNNQIVERLSYDAWGNRRNPTDWTPLSSNVTSQVDRGFTGHEHLDALELIHMNGRVYDPVIGRFLSPDPFVQAPLFSQSLNRYSYVLNNPLSLVDPSGYNWFSDTFNLRTVVPIAIGIATAYFGGGALIAGVLDSLAGACLANSAAIGAGAAFGFGSAFSGVVLSGGNAVDGLRAGLTAGAIGGVSAGLTYKVGALFGHETIRGGPGSNVVKKMIAHGVVQGSVTELQGGNFKHGFLSGSLSTFASPSVQGNTIAMAVIGGTTAELGGGKFANGAVTGAFISMFNEKGEGAASRSMSTFGEFIAGTDEGVISVFEDAGNFIAWTWRRAGLSGHQEQIKAALEAEILVGGVTQAATYYVDNFWEVNGAILDGATYYVNNFSEVNGLIYESTSARELGRMIGRGATLSLFAPMKGAATAGALTHKANDGMITAEEAARGYLQGGRY